MDNKDKSGEDDRSQTVVFKQSCRWLEDRIRHEEYLFDWTIKEFGTYNYKHSSISFHANVYPFLRVALKSLKIEDYFAINITFDSEVERKGTVNVCCEETNDATINEIYHIDRTIDVHTFGRNTLTMNYIIMLKEGYITRHTDGRSLTLPFKLCLESDLTDQGKFLDVIHNFETLLEDATFSDVILCLRDDVEIPAHKAILSAQSPVFKAMFGHDMNENKENKVAITDIEPNVMKALLSYIYTGEIGNVSGLAEDLLKACNKYGLNESKLCSFCGEVLCMDISKKNALQLLVLADQFNATAMKTRVIDFVLRNIKSLLKAPEWSTFKSVANQRLFHELFETLGDSKFEVQAKP